mmetsp:Transcript_41087/g.95179  ORF Transcript_41087/g.95179 Transcript_41087/m.95179 type:complete len:293 (-) Transcript_41087:9-887(-)
MRPPTAITSFTTSIPTSAEQRVVFQPRISDATMAGNASWAKSIKSLSEPMASKKGTSSSSSTYATASLTKYIPTSALATLSTPGPPTRIYQSRNLWSMSRALRRKEGTQIASANPGGAKAALLAAFPEARARPAEMQTRINVKVSGRDRKSSQLRTPCFRNASSRIRSRRNIRSASRSTRSASWSFWSGASLPLSSRTRRAVIISSRIASRSDALEASRNSLRCCEPRARICAASRSAASATASLSASHSFSACVSAGLETGASPCTAWAGSCTAFPASASATACAASSALA